jgi:cobalt/nickel transport system permease protein
MFRTITAFSKINRLSKVHPVEKILLSIVPIILIGYTRHYYSIAINIILFLILHIVFKSPRKIVVKFTLAAAGFALISSVTFIFDYGISFCTLIILKTLSSGISLSYLVLTTPLDDVLYFTSRIQSLRDICDITKNMERFLIIIEDEYIILNNSIKSRNGFSDISLKIRNTGKMAGLLFVNTMRKWDDIRDGIDSRCYRGSMPYLKKEFNFSYTRISCIIVYLGILGYAVFFM